MLIMTLYTCIYIVYNFLINIVFCCITFLFYCMYLCTCVHTLEWLAIQCIYLVQKKQERERQRLGRRSSLLQTMGDPRHKWSPLLPVPQLLLHNPLHLNTHNPLHLQHLFNILHLYNKYNKHQCFSHQPVTPLFHFQSSVHLLLLVHPHLFLPFL